MGIGTCASVLSLEREGEEGREEGREGAREGEREGRKGRKEEGGREGEGCIKDQEFFCRESSTIENDGLRFTPQLFQ